ncbi:MAG: acyltransferase family protein [Acidimicrobiales bacterium]
MQVGSPTASSDPAPAAPAGRQVRAFGGYLVGFDGLRGFTIFCVLFYHARLGPYEGFYLSLSLFFVLSGFLITAILLDDRQRSGRIDFRRFWSRRIRRLAPAAILGAVLAVVYGATLATRSQAEQLPGDLVGVVFYVVNWTFITTSQSYTDIFAAPSPVQHYWSLAVEEQFYLVIPLLLGFLLRSKVSYRAIVAVVSATILASTVWMVVLFDGGADVDRLYFGTDTRIAEVMVGVLIAVVMDQRRAVLSERARNLWALAGFPAVVALGWLWTTVGVTESFAYRGGFLLNAVLTGVLIMVLVADRGFLVRIFKFPPAVFIGRFSYGIYIYHFVIFLTLTEERTGLDTWPNCALRFAVTLLVAWLSYRYIEGPIRSGASLGLGRPGIALAYPVAGLLLVVGAYLTANTDGDDPLATLRDDGRSLRAPVATADGVLDIVVIHSAESAAVVDELDEILAGEDTIRLAARSVFGCEGGAVPVGAGTTCGNWVDDWPDLVAEHDPDSVLFFVDGWVDDDTSPLSDQPGVAQAEIADRLDVGFDLLTSNGASVVAVGSGHDYATGYLRGLAPFGRALATLGERADVNVVLSDVMPDPTDISDDTYVETSAETLVDLAALYQRADRADAPRVLIVGDSQARSLGFGLERWAADNGVWVWNAATNGCGLADEGFKYDTGEPRAISDECVDAVGGLDAKVRSFEPDMVVVLTSAWDVGDRRLEAWPEPLSIGDPQFDAYLTDEYRQVADTLTGGGATVVWMLAPCFDRGLENNPLGVSGDWGGARELAVLNDDILPSVAAHNPGRVVLYDLADVLCPDGEPLREADGVSPIRSDGVHFSVDGSAWFAENHSTELLASGGIGEG